ncbi:hypothetical protein [Oenococcus sp.]|uniref:hypothetical protein n=1 Tax=Oenococcus sp. TaxID=1979414 RepID=UPI0039EBFE44
MGAKIINSIGKVVYDASDPAKQIAYYNLIELFANRYPDQDLKSNYFPDFSQEACMLKYADSIEKYGVPELVLKLHRLQKQAKNKTK